MAPAGTALGTTGLERQAFSEQHAHTGGIRLQPASINKSSARVPTTLKH
jgi:hypothetical protein